GRGEHAENLPLCVLVDGGVVQHVGQAAILVPDRQGVVGDKPLGEHLLVALPGLLRLGEVVGEVGADQPSRATPVTFTVASFTSVIFPSGLIVTSGSRLASIKLRAYSAACFWAVTSRAAAN